MKTLEEKFLAEYESMELELENAKERIAELEDKLSSKHVEEQTDEELESRPTAWRLNEPIELVSVKIAPSYNYEHNKYPLGMTSDEIRESVSTREGLESLCSKVVGYGPYMLLSINETVCPFQFVSIGQTWGVDTRKSYYGGEFSFFDYFVSSPSDGFEDSRYYRSENRDALYEWGLEKLKKQLLEYADKLDKEADDAD